jgi:hypothetical protein
LGSLESREQRAEEEEQRAENREQRSEERVIPLHPLLVGLCYHQSPAFNTVHGLCEDGIWASERISGQTSSD